MNKTWYSYAGAIGMAILRGIVGLLTCLCFLATILSFMLQQTIAAPDLYRRAAQNPTLPQELVDYARPDLENECLFYGLPMEIVDEALSVETAQAFIGPFIDAVYDALFVSGTLEVPAVDEAIFRGPIAARLEKEGVEAQVIDDLAAEFTAVTTASWQMGLSKKLLSPAHRILSNVWVTRFLNGGPLLAGATALLFGIGLLLGMRHIRRTLFDLLGALTVSSMLLYIPLWLLDDYGIASKLVLGDSPLRTYFITLMDSITAQLANGTMWVLIACAVLTVPSVVWLVWPKNEVVSPADEPAEEEIAPVEETISTEE